VHVQLERMFGEGAAHPVTEILKDWAPDRYTATAADLRGVAEHGVAPPNSAQSGVWRNRLAGIASEWSPRFGGYVAGAVDAAKSGVRAIGASGNLDLTGDAAHRGG
jgi:monoamine oxidase